MMLHTLRPNCTVVQHEGGETLFSYDTAIMTVANGEITNVTVNWDYSKTTGKHLNEFLEYVGLKQLATYTRAQKRKYFKEKGLI